MTSPIRNQVLQALDELSRVYPEWRFGQLIANMALVARGTEPAAIWDMEDEELLTAIRWQLDQRRSKPSSVA